MWHPNVLRRQPCGRVTFNIATEPTSMRVWPSLRTRAVRSAPRLLAAPWFLRIEALGKDSYGYWALLSKTLSVQLDAFNLVQCFSGQVTLPTFISSSACTVITY